jgi:CO/xanthine dehydrogenase Mo-binding subunit
LKTTSRVREWFTTAAIANAVFHAIGMRTRSLPITVDRLS